MPCSTSGKRSSRAEIFPISATENFNVDNLYKRILELLPVGEPYFDKEEMTDMPARFFLF